MMPALVTRALVVLATSTALVTTTVVIAALAIPAIAPVTVAMLLVVLLPLVLLHLLTTLAAMFARICLVYPWSLALPSSLSSVRRKSNPTYLGPGLRT